MRAHTPLTERQVSNLIKNESEARIKSELGTYVPYQSLKYTTSIEGKNKKEKELREILDALIPPKSNPQNTDEILYASLDIPTREEIKKQWKTLDFILQLRQARETGICPIREQVYCKTFSFCKCHFLRKGGARTVVLSSTHFHRIKRNFACFSFA